MEKSFIRFLIVPATILLLIFANELYKKPFGKKFIGNVTLVVTTVRLEGRFAGFEYGFLPERSAFFLASISFFIEAEK